MEVWVIVQMSFKFNVQICYYIRHWFKYPYVSLYLVWNRCILR
uniref:Uncharacterized protein n=1 Tax=Lepeophtheirus salmonis TaxID=72036 RepID=A0A0K2SZ04_LEPSM